MTAPDELRSAIDMLLGVPFEKHALNPEFGAINFEQALPELSNLRRILAALKIADLSIVPKNRRDRLLQSVKNSSEQIQRMNNFSLQQANPHESRNSIQNDIVSAYSDLFDKAVPLVAPDLFAKDVDAERAKIDEIAQQMEKIYAEQQQVLAEAQQTLGAIKKASAEAGVASEAKHFADAAADHQSAATKWGFATGIVAATGVIWGLLVVWTLSISSTATPAEIVQQALGKLIVFTALYYALIFCARNYSANRHNYVVNHHKANSLATFETFVRAANQDTAIKNAVLLQATSSIFSPPPSGYAQFKESDGDSPNKIIEITKMSSEKPS